MTVAGLGRLVAALSMYRRRGDIGEHVPFWTAGRPGKPESMIGSARPPAKPGTAVDRFVRRAVRCRHHGHPEAASSGEEKREESRRRGDEEADDLQPPQEDPHRPRKERRPSRAAQIEVA